MPNKQQWSLFEWEYLDERGTAKPTTNWNFKDVNSERGTEMFIKYLGFSKDDFPNPKPVGTIQRAIQIATDKDSIILDSFAGSGTTAQAVSLDAILKELGISLDAVLNLNVPSEELVKRISERAVLENRADDNPETVQKRLAVYEESTKPLIDYYRNSGLYQEINGLQDVDAVFADIIKALEK